MKALWGPVVGLAVAGCSPSIDDIYAKVLSDSIIQYDMARESGKPVDRCVQAGLVVAAASQAKNQDAYAKWIRTRTKECEDAGISGG